MRLFRRFEEGELDALRANGEGLLGGPPTTSKSDGCEATSRLEAGGPALIEARELRRSFGGGMGEGDDMTESQRTRACVGQSLRPVVCTGLRYGVAVELRARCGEPWLGGGRKGSLCQCLLQSAGGEGLCTGWMLRNGRMFPNERDHAGVAVRVVQKRDIDVLRWRRGSGPSRVTGWPSLHVCVCRPPASHRAASVFDPFTVYILCSMYICVRTTITRLPAAPSP